MHYCCLGLCGTQYEFPSTQTCIFFVNFRNIKDDNEHKRGQWHKSENESEVIIYLYTYVCTKVTCARKFMQGINILSNKIKYEEHYE